MPLKPKGPVRPISLRSFMMRRVYLQGAHFICGICRTQHSSAEDANSCLHKCWQAMLKEAPWTSHKRLGKTEYHCVYCQRSYDTTEAAMRCATDCAQSGHLTEINPGEPLVARAKRTFGKRPPVKISLKVPYKIGKPSADVSVKETSDTPADSLPKTPASDTAPTEASQPDTNAPASTQAGTPDKQDQPSESQLKKPDK